MVLSLFFEWFVRYLLNVWWDLSFGCIKISCMCCLAGKYGCFSEELVARPANLAQASQSRLGEMKQGGSCTKSRPGDSLTF